MNNTTFTQLAIMLFALVGLGHLFRALFNLPINLMGWDIPTWLSWILGVVFLWLAYSGYKVLKEQNQQQALGAQYGQQYGQQAAKINLK